MCFISLRELLFEESAKLNIGMAQTWGIPIDPGVNNSEPHRGSDTVPLSSPSSPTDSRIAYPFLLYSLRPS